MGTHERNGVTSGYHTSLHDSELRGVTSELVVLNTTAGLGFYVRYFEDRNRQFTDGYIGLLCRSCDPHRGYVKSSGVDACEQCDRGADQNLAHYFPLFILAICLVKYPSETMAFF
jgi:hypothetical protein